MRWQITAQDGNNNTVIITPEIGNSGSGIDIRIVSATDSSITITGTFSTGNWLIIGIAAASASASGSVSSATNSFAIYDSRYQYGGDAPGNSTPGNDEPSSGGQVGYDTGETPGGVSTETPDGDSTTPMSDNEPLSQGRIVPISSSDLASGVLAKIAGSANISVSDINFITQSDISSAPDPTQAMRQKAQDENLEFAAKLQTVKFRKSGYYLFEVDFPQELVGTNVNDLKFYFTSGTSSSAVQSSQALALMADRFFAGNELRNLLGDFAETVPGKALILLAANTGGSFAMYALKTILMLFAGGCTSGLGVIGLVAVGIVFFRKH